jgi:hypothetical protein
VDEPGEGIGMWQNQPSSASLLGEPGEGPGVWQNWPLSTSLLGEPGEVAPGRISDLTTLLLE